MKPKHRCQLGILGALVFTANLVHGAAITQTANDTSSPANSFTEAARWSNTAVPTAGNTYSNNGFLFRTPNTNPASVSFAGDSLTITPRSSASGVGAALITKGTVNQTVSFTNLILSGGIVSQGTQGVTHTIAGAITSNAPSGFSITDSSDRNFAITAAVSGSSRLYVGSFNSYNASGYTPTAFTNTFTVSGNNSSFSGGWSLGGSYLATFFGGSTTYNNIFNASGTTFRLGHVNALGTGTVQLNAGTLNLNGFSPSGLAGVSFSDSAAATIRTAGNTLTSTSLNFGTTTGASPRIDFGGAGYPASAPLNTTNLSVNGPTPITLTGASFTTGTFPLIAYSGTIGGTNGFSDLSLSLPLGVQGSLTNTPGSLISVNISSVDSITWTNGGATGLWNTADSNWKNAANTATTYQQNSLGGYSVIFDESETTASPVAVGVPSSVSPNSITINNPTKDYVFSGVGGISGNGSLTKNGAGDASFANALSFAGPTTINAGHVTLTGTNKLGSGTVTVASGAFLTYNNSGNVTQGASSSAGMTFTGAGTIEKKGANTVTFADGTGKVNWNLSSGSLIDVQAGKMVGGSNNNDIWTNNKSDLNIAAGATFDSVEADVTVDALTGSGIYQCGFFGPRNLRVGADGGSGTFSGTLQTNANGGVSSSGPILYKLGAGTQTLDGTLNFYNYYSGTCLQVSGGTLNISPTGPSVIGSTGSDVFVSPGQTDVATLNQTAGTITTRNMSVGQQGAASYNISSGTLNASKIELAFTGPTTGAGAVSMGIRGTAAVNVNSNGGILMGQYYGRPVTVTQTGGNVVCFSDAGVTRGGSVGLRFLSGTLSAIYNLSGGTLSIPAITRSSGAGFGGGNGTINFNGGTLQITSSSFSIPTGTANSLPVIALKVLGDELTPNSGAIIDNYGLPVTIAAGLLHGGSSFLDGGLRVSSSVSGGSLTLSGINTYTGSTTIASGSTLNLADNAQLKLVLDGSNNTKITGAGTANLDGDLNIDTTYADLTSGNTWTLVDVATRNYGGTFTVVGFTGASGVWTKTDGANVWSFSQATGVLTLTVVQGYATWIGGFNVSDAGTSADPDYDGTSNLLEYVLNGNPSASDPGILPTLDTAGSNFVFHFTRREESATDTTQVFQYGSDLVGWTSINITPPVGAGVTLGTPSGGTQEITVTIPKSVAVGGKLFGRLKATKP